jgi:hypothetical protein
MIININNFSQIKPLKSNTLIVLDIDDTIMSFKNIDKTRWNDIYNTYLSYYKDDDKAYKKSEILWTKHISKSKPKLLDEHNFINFLGKISKNNCELIFLTARNKNISDLTMDQLSECGLNINPSKVFFSRNKGIELKNIVEQKYPNVKNIIFVDDLEGNLVNVQLEFNTSKHSKYNLDLYKINHN